MWEDVIGILGRRDQIGSSIRLQCRRHPEALLTVLNYQDFEIVAPEGGCTAKCRQRLKCGHACELLCHAEIRHQVVQCRKACERGRPECGHACSKACYEPCGKCMVLVSDVVLPCGHLLPPVECWISQDLTVPQAKCRTQVVRTLPDCGHQKKMLCGDDEKEIQCTSTCGGALQCRHSTCANPCHTCKVTDTRPDGQPAHSPCQQKCDKGFTTCSHRCSRPCHPNHDNCGVCTERCQLGCVHSRCTGKCGQDCVPCAESCTWECIHIGECTMPCGAPCDRFPCDKRCHLPLDCGHQCPSICGEICPPREFCQVCGDRDPIIDFIEFKSYKTLDLDQDPIIVLPCHHFYPTGSLDKVMEMDKAYTRGSNGQFVEIVRNGNMSLQPRRCPECRMPISRVQRYNRITKRLALDTLLRGIISRSHIEYTELEKQMNALEEEMSESRDQSLKALNGISRASDQQRIKLQNTRVINGITDKFAVMKRNVDRFVQKVHEEKQPHVRVYRNSIAAQSRRKEAKVSRYDTPSPDIKHRILGNILKFRLELLQHTEMMTVADRLSSLPGCSHDAEKFRKDIGDKCRTLRRQSKKRKQECDGRQYPGLSVEILLLQMQAVQLEIRTASNESVIKYRQEGLHIFSECEKYFAQYASCDKYRPAAERGKDMLLRSSGPFYQAVSSDERKTILVAMQAELRGTGHWYYCRNGHPVSSLRRER